MEEDKKSFLSSIEQVLSTIPIRPKNWKFTKKGKDIKINKIFEIYLLSLIGQVFHEEGYLVEHSLKNRMANKNDDFTIRGAPGKLTGDRKFSYLLVTKSNRKFEVQVGIEVDGLSSLKHEVDVGVFLHSSAQLVRQQNRSDLNICYNHVPISIECKYYEKTNQKKGIGREFLGIARDLDRNKEMLGILATRKKDDNAQILLPYYNLIHIQNFNHLKKDEFKEVIREYVRRF